MHEDPAQGVYVKGVTEVYVASVEETMDILRQGSANRAVGHTRMLSLPMASRVRDGMAGNVLCIRCRPQSCAREAECPEMCCALCVCRSSPRLRP